MVIGASAVSMAYEHHYDPYDGHGRHRGYSHERYDGYSGGCPGMRGVAALPADKQAELDKLTLEHEQALAPKAQELRAKRMELRALSGNSSIKRDDISQLAQQVAQLESDLRTSEMEFRDKVGVEYGVTLWTGPRYHEPQMGGLHR